MTDEPLTARLRRHAHDLGNGGTNAGELRDDLIMAAEHLDAAAEIIKLKTKPTLWCQICGVTLTGLYCDDCHAALGHPPDAQVG